MCEHKVFKVFIGFIVAGTIFASDIWGPYLDSDGLAFTGKLASNLIQQSVNNGDNVFFFSFFIQYPTHSQGN